MPIPTDADIDRIDAVLAAWQQGDLVPGDRLPFAFIASSALPLSPAAQQATPDPADELLLVEVTEPGFALLTQTCDVVRSCRVRPFVELAPLVAAAPDTIEECRRLKRASLAWHPAAAARGLVVDLDRTLTIEKALLVGFNREPGLTSTADLLAFQEALAAKRARFAFPDDFVAACRRFSARVKDKAARQSPEGRHLEALDEIRVHAAPDWSAAAVDLTFWLIKRGDPPVSDWPAWVAHWQGLIDTSGRFGTAVLRVATLDDMTARDHQASHHLDFDQLSVPAKP